MNLSNRFTEHWPHIEAIAGPHPDDIDSPCPECRSREREMRAMLEALERARGRIRQLVDQHDDWSIEARLLCSSNLALRVACGVLIVVAVWGWMR